MAVSGGIRVFDGATAIVTGAASGIGKALAVELAKRGCEVVLADLQTELAGKVASGIVSSGGRAEAVETDVTDFAAVEQLVLGTVRRADRLDYMFNNAGIAIAGNAIQHCIEDWNSIVDVNLKGVINGTHTAYRVMAGQGFGHIVNTASLAGLIPAPGLVSYAVTKHAVVGLSTSMRAEAAQLGIRVSVLCPGVIRTPILDAGGKYGKMLMDIPPEKQSRMWNKMKPMAPEVFADKALHSIARNKALIVLPSWWRMLWLINRLLPSVGIELAGKSFQYLQKQLGNS